MIKPLHDFIVVQVDVKQTTTESGLIIPDSSTDDQTVQGKVLAVGPGKVSASGEVEPLEIAVGDGVVFSKSTGTEFPDKGGVVTMLRESEVIAVLG